MNCSLFFFFYQCARNVAASKRIYLGKRTGVIVIGIAGIVAGTIVTIGVGMTVIAATMMTAEETGVTGTMTAGKDKNM